MRHTTKRMGGWAAALAALWMLGCLTAAQAGYVDAVSATPGLQHFWQLDEPGTPTVSLDSIGGKTVRHYNGFPPSTIGAGPGSTAGPRPSDGFAGMDASNAALLYDIPGKTRSFGADADQVGSSKTFSGGDMTGLSMEFWYKLTATGNEGVLLGYNDTSGARYGFTVFKNGGSGNGLRVYNKDMSSNQTQYNLGDTPDTSWHHMALTWDGTHFRAYLDGQETAASVASSDGAASGAIQPLDQLVFGGDASTIDLRYFNGALDQVAIYDRALTSAQIGRHYQAAATGSFSVLPAERAVLDLNPVHYWRMEETYGATALDSVDNWTGTLQNNPTLGDVGPRPPDFKGFESDNHAVGLVRSSSTGIAVADVDQLTAGESFSAGDVDALSMSAWFRLSETGPDNARQIIAGFQKSSGYRYTYLVARESNGALRFYLSDGDDQSQQINVAPYPNITDSEWHQVVMAWDGSALRTYLDGTNEQVFTDPDVQGALFVPDGFFIGRDINGSNYFDGQIDDVALFNYALSAGQVAAMYQWATVPEPSALVLLVLGAIGCAGTVRCRRRPGA